MSRLVRICVRHPLVVACLAAGVAAFAAAGLPRLRTEVGYRAFLGDAHPAVRRLDAFLARFGGGLPIAAVYGCGESPCATALDPEALRMAHAVARALENEPGVARVDDPATSPLLVRDLGLPTTRRLAPEGTPAPDLAELAAAAREDPLWRGNLVSADGRAGAILVHLSSSEVATGRRAVQALRAALAPWEARGFRFHLVGGPVEFVVAGDELARVTARLVPAMVAVVGLVLAWSFRSLTASLLVLGSVGLAVLCTTGLQGWLGWPRNTLTEVLPPLVLVMGVCDAVHLLAAYGAAAAPGTEAGVAITRASGRVGRACVLTTLTTAAGFASFAGSELESFVRFGWLAAAGVVFALLASFTVLPAAASRLPPRPHAPAAGRAPRGAALRALARVSQRHAAGVLALAAAAGAAGAVGFASLRVEASFEGLYGEDSDVVRWAHAASALLREPETLEVALVPPQPELPPSARTLRAVDRLERELDALDGLGPAVSVLSPLRSAHRLLHGGPLPLDDGGKRAASLWRLARAEEPELLHWFVDPRSGAVRISLQAEKLSQERLRATLAAVDRRVAALRPAGYETVVTGATAVLGGMIEAIQHTQRSSFATAALAVGLLIALFLRSLPAALLALLPTLLAVAVTLGAMGGLGVPLDIGSAMVAAVVLGLAVDDAIHLLSAWQARRREGASSSQAIQDAVGEVGRALVMTSVALAAGFAVLGAMPWRSIASFGRISAVAILGALLANLVVLPALLVQLDRRGRRRAPPSPA